MEKNEFHIPKNVVPLPSKGKLYPDNIDSVELEYMTAEDEDILATPSLLQNGNVLDVLLKKKMINCPLKPSDLILGDKNRLLLQLRADSYGQYYPVSVTCPFTGNNFEHNVDLVQLYIKELDVDPDEKMLFTYTLPLTKDVVKFKLLTSGEMDKVLRYIKDNKQYNNGIETNITSLLRESIKSINGKDDLEYIHKYVKVMKAGDSIALRKYIDKISPTVDNTVTVISPYTDKKFNAKISFGVDFFYPSI